MKSVLKFAAAMAPPLLFASVSVAADACSNLSTVQSVPVRAYQDGRVVRFSANDARLFYEKRHWPAYQASKREMNSVVSSGSLQAVFLPVGDDVTMQIVDVSGGGCREVLAAPVVVPLVAAPKTVVASN